MDSKLFLFSFDEEEHFDFLEPNRNHDDEEDDDEIPFFVGGDEPPMLEA
jgi:hypothetical protein